MSENCDNNTVKEKSTTTKFTANFPLPSAADTSQHACMGG
jgi:hypothetical protein